MGLVPGGSTGEGILQQWEESAKALKIDRVRQFLFKLLHLLTTAKVSIYLLHTPDINTPISSTMEGVQALYLAGKFDHVYPPPSFIFLTTNTKLSSASQTSPPPK
jgi:aryl-alcohol dehydrogenase-like predicted oxidoreductase